jgi:hypothetical protein
MVPPIVLLTVVALSVHQSKKCQQYILNLALPPRTTSSRRGLYQAASLVAAAPASNGNQHGSTQSHSIAAMVGASPDSNKDPSSSKRIRSSRTTKRCILHRRPLQPHRVKAPLNGEFSSRVALLKSPGVKRSRPLEYGKDKEEASKLATNEDDLMLDKGIVDDDSVD